jgi:hypothetical protein
LILEDISGPQPEQLQSMKVWLYGHFRWLSFSPDGRHLACATDENAIVLEVATFKTVWKWDAPGDIEWIEWAADGLIAAGVLGLLTGVFALEAQKSMIVGAGSLLFFSASPFPFVTVRSARSRKTLFEVCVADLEGERPSPESVRFAMQLIDRQLSS